MRVFRQKVAGSQFLFEHLADQLTRAFHRAVGFLDVPVVPADHHPRFVRQDFDGFVQRQLKVRRTEQQRPRQVQPDVAIDKGHAQQIAAPRIGQVHEEKARAWMPFDQAGHVQRMRAANEGGAEVHLHWHVPLPRQLGEPVHDEIAEGLPFCRGGRGFAPGPAGELFVRRFEGQIAIVGQRIFQGDLVS